MTLKSPIVIFQALEPLQPQWPQQPQHPQWPQWPQQPHFIKKFTDPDGWIIPGTKMTNNGPFLWNGSSKIQFFTNIWHPFCRRLLRPADGTFLKTGWWNTNEWLLWPCSQRYIIKILNLSTPQSHLDHIIMRHPVCTHNISQSELQNTKGNTSHKLILRQYFWSFGLPNICNYITVLQKRGHASP